MPASSVPLSPDSRQALKDLGSALRQRRKALGVSAVAAAEAAHLSRVTLHRIEKGEPSVTLGAYAQVAGVLGLAIRLAPHDEAPARPPAGRKGWLPARVAIADYPQLKRLAWHVQGPQQLTPRETLDIYERHGRHLDASSMTDEERDLLEALRLAFASGPAGAHV